MIFCFDGKTAEKYGIEEAILIHNFQFWIAKNKANGKHYHEGRFWTYNSAAALTELFPFMSAKKIQRTLKNLVERGVLVRGSFNENPYDRTCWYAFADGWSLDGTGQNGTNALDKSVQSTLDKSVQSTLDKSVQPIPDSNTDSITDKKISTASADKKPPMTIPPTVYDVAAYCRSRNNGIDAEHFCDHYQAKGWKVGKERMKDWQAAVRTWEKHRKATEPRGMAYKTYEPPQPVPEEETVSLEQIRALKNRYANQGD